MSRTFRSNERVEHDRIARSHIFGEPEPGGRSFTTKKIPENFHISYGTDWLTEHGSKVKRLMHSKPRRREAQRDIKEQLVTQ